MKRPHGNRARLGGVLLAVALGALALLALPTIGLSHDSDGDHSPPAAGTIASFDPETGELVVDLADGGSISALVVRRTQIRCGEGRHHLRGHGHRGWHGATASRHGESESGDDRGGRGEEEAGDDRGGHGLEAGDGHGDEADGDNHDHGQHGDEPGEDNHDHSQGHHGERCNTSDLVEGAVVMHAEIVLTHGKALYKKIGLLPPQFAADE